MYRLQFFTALKTVDPTVLVDVIGRVAEIYSPLDKLISGRPSRLIDFLIEDLNGHQLKCTVWDQHVEKVMPYFRKDFVEPVIVLIRMGRVKVSEHSAEVKITSSYDATQLLFNGDSTEFLEFRDSLTLQQTPLKSITSNSAYSDGNSSGGDLSSSKMRIITISDIFQNREVGEFWVPAQIIGIESDVMIGFSSFAKDQDASQLGGWAGSSRRLGDALTSLGTAPFLLWDREALDFVSVKAEMFNTYCPGLLDDYDDCLSSKLQLTDNESDSDVRKRHPNMNVVKELSVHVTETEAVKRILLDQFSSTQTSKKKKLAVGKEEKGVDDKET
nr:replication protein A 70 kDa DNA-binding subunit D-like [Ipomoea batatas]